MLKQEGVMCMKEELTNKGFDVIVPFLVGGVVGAGVALLFAPKSGRELRSDIKRFSGTAKDRVNLAIGKGKELYEEGRAKVMGAIDAGKTAIVHEKAAVVGAIDAGKTAYAQEKEKWQHV
jgi:gas vesicle protein